MQKQIDGQRAYMTKTDARRELTIKKKKNVKNNKQTYDEVDFIDRFDLAQ